MKCVVVSSEKLMSVVIKFKPHVLHDHFCTSVSVYMFHTRCITVVGGLAFISFFKRSLNHYCTKCFLNSSLITYLQVRHLSIHRSSPGRLYSVFCVKCNCCHYLTFKITLFYLLEITITLFYLLQMSSKTRLV